MMLSLTEGIGDDCAAGEVCFCGDGVLLGVADCAAFDGDGVGVGVSDFAAFDGVGMGDLCAPDDEDFDFAAGVGVGLGEGVCALRSTPR